MISPARHPVSPRSLLIAIAAQALAAAAVAAEKAPAAAVPQPPALCSECGVVRSIRQIERPVPPKRELLPDMASSAGSSDSMNMGMQTMPQFTFGGGSGVQRVERQPVTRSAWEVIIRYDNGQFGAVNVDTEPMLQVGDRVRRFENTVELLPKDAR